jgi:hypothetical protein
MAITTTSSFTGATVPTVPGNVLKLMIAAARMTPQLQGNLTTLVTNDPLPNGQGTTWNSPKFGTYTAFSLTQGVDLTQQQALAVTNIVITPAEVGVQAVFTWKSLAQWSENVISRAGEIMRRAMDRKKDIDIGGLFTGLDRAANTATGQFLSVGHLTAAVSMLAGGSTVAAGVAIAAGTGINTTEEGPFHGVFRPESLHSLSRTLTGGPAATTATVTAATGVGASGGPGSVGNEVTRNGVLSLYHGHIGGVDLYRCANLAKDTADDAIGAVFVKGALVYVPMEYKGTGDEMIEDDKSLRASELNYVEDYGFGELDGTQGVSLTVDALPATS